MNANDGGQPWINRKEYPFRNHFLALPAGRMHYVDEGQGEVIVMVHGTPTWSFLYRHMIKALAPSYRVISPDHLGFGLSEKPVDWTYLPSDHADNLAELIAELGLRDITLVVHDFGGPIGLSYAINHPDQVKRLVILNTFCWSLKGDQRYENPGRIFQNPLGRFIYRNLNFSAEVMVRAAWGKQKPLTREIHRHYTQALTSPDERQGTWVFLQELIGSSAWYQSLWDRREVIRDKPALIAWGMRDFAFQETELQRWSDLFPTATVMRFPQAGHFIQEEVGDELALAMSAWMSE